MSSVRSSPYLALDSQRDYRHTDQTWPLTRTNPLGATVFTSIQKWCIENVCIENSNDKPGNQHLTERRLVCLAGVQNLPNQRRITRYGIRLYAGLGTNIISAVGNAFNNSGETSFTAGRM